MRSLTLLTLGLLAISSARAADIQMTPILTEHNFERPITIQTPDDGTNREFLVEQTGKIKLLHADAEPSVFLDISDRNLAERDFEEGLLGLAFHPDFAENQKFYIYYSQQGPKRSVVSELVADGNQADMSSERILMEISQPEWNHNSGNILFGPDGYFYICVGDGGMKNGVFLLSQKLTRWNGKILRIDVNEQQDGMPYGIPADNPFLDEPIAAPEIYALGFRNPWGAAFDEKTGQFWVADVGQNLYEEVNIVEKGGNYGWEFREGMHKFQGRDLLMDALNVNRKDPPEGVDFIDPIWEYDHVQGLSITGGFVYRGDQIPELNGYYIVGDWKSGNTWAIQYDADSGKITDEKEIYRPDVEEKFQPTAFVPSLDGGIRVLNWDGRIFQMEN